MLSNLKASEPISYKGKDNSLANVDFGATTETQTPTPTPIPTPATKSPISGIACDNATQRPVAVMLSSDAEARPLSAVSAADMVFEMPVVEGGITRLMAVYLCNAPSEIGSVRSARHDFIPLAKGLDAVYAHWGGSHFALEKLSKRVIDDIDALKNPYGTYYRKSGISMPHNGFTNTERLRNAIDKMGFRKTSNFAGYPHTEVVDKNEKATPAKLSIGYPGAFFVEYQYDPQNNTYWRFRSGVPEIDANTGTQVGAKNIVVMRTTSRQLEGQYNDVDVEGEGTLDVYQNGQVIAGAWSKDKASLDSKLFFKDKNGQEISFVPGAIWVQIIEPDKEVSYK